MTAAVLTAAMVATGWARLPEAWRMAGVGAAAALLHPAAVAAAAAALALPSLRRRARPAGGALLLADQTALGLRAGLTLEDSLREAAADLPPATAAEVLGVLRAARRHGLGEALRDAGGEAERVYRITERAVRTGAPLGEAVEALAAELRHEEHARQMAAARRLPVRMLLPLALLILPGFVLALVGPAVVSSLARLEIGW
ncbi:MAG: type II secretion system F family protein [Actinobacteria bacterium]|nr:type II secretion system F family protein [Actinomycetota bacterium]